MEIYAQQTFEYNFNPDDLTKYEIYELTQSGYIFKSKVDGFNQGELDALAIYPPNVTFDQYMRYRSMSIYNYEKLFPYLKLIIDPTFEDYFYYATRGWIPRYILSFQPLYERYKQYMSLSEASRSLIDKIYGSMEKYIRAVNNSIYDTYIFAFDQSMDSTDMVQTIGKNIGIFVPIIANNAVEFIEKLMYILDSGIDKDVALKIIKMDFNQYVKSKDKNKGKPIDELILLYMDRLYEHVFSN